MSEAQMNAVVKDLAIVREKLNNPETHWELVSPVVKALFKHDILLWAADLQQKEAALLQKEAALLQKEAALQQEKVLNLQIQLEEKTMGRTAGLLNEQVMQELLRRLGANTEPTSLTPAALGQTTFDEVTAINGFFQHSSGVGDAILTLDQQEVILSLTSEKQFGVVMTANLNQILSQSGYPLVYVNSEEFRWLPQAQNLPANTSLKPDGFVTLSGCYISRDEPKDHMHPYRKQYVKEIPFAFGLPFEGLFDSAVIVEYKLLFTMGDGFGQVVMYVEKLPNLARAVLFDRERCWLIRSRAKRVVRIDEIYWTTPGSKRIFSDFIFEALHPWMHLLSLACKTLNVSLVDKEAFLGAGANGRVFKVRCENGTLAALKIVSSNAWWLQAESEALVQAHGTGVVATVVTPFTEISTGSGSYGAAMLISPVGKPITRSSLTENHVLQILSSLYKLHSAGFQHGDPRLANIILNDDKFIWIDFMACVSSMNSGWERDACILACSILRVPNKSDLPPDVVISISEYAEDKDLDSCQRLASKLWSNFRSL